MMKKWKKNICSHISFSSGSAQTIVIITLSHLTEAQISLLELDVVRCDGSITNTGWKTSVIRTIEEEVKRPLQWGQVSLYYNEFSFLYLFQTLDDETVGQNLLDFNCAKKAVSCLEYLAVREPGTNFHSR